MARTEPMTKKKSPFLSLSTFITIVITLVLRVFVVQGCTTPTGSMENTILGGETMLVNKFIYGAQSPKYIPFTDIGITSFRLPAIRHPQRGDIVVFNWPGMRDEVIPHERTDYLKRCIGLPGDRIQIVDRAVYVNGELFPNPPGEKIESNQILPRSYSNPQIFPEGSGYNEDNYGPIVVPKKGDRISVNAGTFTKWKIFIEREGHTCILQNGSVLVDGKKKTEYVVTENYYFMMGDNRENSLDSRFWGFVPWKSIVGEPMFIYMSWNPDVPLYDVFAKIGSVRWDRIGVVLN